MEEILRELGSVSQKCRKVSWQEARKSYCEVLTSLATKYTVPEGSPLQLIFSDGCEGFIGGDEHIIIRSKENNIANISKEERIYKITHSENFGCDVLFDPYDNDLTGKNFHARGNPDPWLYIKRWQLLNSISDYTTRFEAIIEAEKEG